MVECTALEMQRPPLADRGFKSLLLRKFKIFFIDRFSRDSKISPNLQDNEQTINQHSNENESYKFPEKGISRELYFLITNRNPSCLEDS